MLGYLVRGLISFEQKKITCEFPLHLKYIHACFGVFLQPD